MSSLLATQKKVFTRTDMWREGKYIDLWSLVHLLSGFIGGLVPFYLGLSLWVSVLIALVLFVLWEIFERYMGVGEVFTNQISDVVFGMLGFFITFPLITYFSAQQLHVAFVGLWILNLTLSFFGWRTAARAAFLRKAFEEEVLLEKKRLQKMRTEFSEELREFKEEHRQKRAARKHKRAQRTQSR